MSLAFECPRRWFRKWFRAFFGKVVPKVVPGWFRRSSMRLPVFDARLVPTAEPTCNGFPGENGEPVGAVRAVLR